MKERSIVMATKSELRRNQALLNYKQNGGNMKKAMIDAGYSETYADKNARYLLGIIGEEIKEIQEEIKSDKIKSVQDIQEWWSENIDDVTLDMSTRMKSSELLVRSQGGFIDTLKGDINVSNKLEDLL
jgi:thioredoxin-related protein